MLSPLSVVFFTDRSPHPPCRHAWHRKFYVHQTFLVRSEHLQFFAFCTHSLTHRVHNFDYNQRIWQRKPPFRPANIERKHGSFCVSGVCVFSCAAKGLRRGAIVDLTKGMCLCNFGHVVMTLFGNWKFLVANNVPLASIVHRLTSCSMADAEQIHSSSSGTFRTISAYVFVFIITYARKERKRERALWFSYYYILYIYII